MKLSGNKIQTDFTPLQVTGAFQLTGGSAVQFYDGIKYSPNREGTPASPILLKHVLSVINVDGSITIAPATLFYENGVLITSSTSGYELIGTDSVKVTKNIPAGSSVDIKAITKFVDPRNDKVYEREDFITLRTILKAEPQYILTLSKRGAVYFDAYRNPNVSTTVIAALKKGNTEVNDFTGITFKWLNAAGLDAVENELYADAVSVDGKTITVDKTYIDHEQIKCEAWRGTDLIASDTVTFIRKFNSFQTDIRIPELPLLPGVNTLNCSIIIRDNLGNIDVDAAFLVNWMVSEAGIERQVAAGSSVQIPISAINLKAANLMIYPDLKRREAFAALTTDDPDELLTDDLDNVLTVETYGN